MMYTFTDFMARPFESLCSNVFRGLCFITAEYCSILRHFDVYGEWLEPIPLTWS
jgi:hypothetical protein